MGLLNKLKNTFFEEEYVEVDEPTQEIKVAKKVEVEDIKKEKKFKPTIEEIEKEEKEELEEEPIAEKVVEEPKQEFFSDREIINKGSSLVSYDDEDFEPTIKMPIVTNNEKKEPKRIYGEVAPDMHINLDDMDKYKYPSHKAYGATEENKFEPTPIISPIYGILDKNYRKEEVIDKRDKPSSYVSRKNVDLDSIRKKAFGEDVAIKVEEVKEEKEEEQPLLYDMIEETKPTVEDVTVGDAEEYFNDLGLEYNVDYKDEKYENATGRRSDIHKEENSLNKVIVDNSSDEDDDDITLDELISRNKSNNDDIEESANLEDNLFDLVDSMYEGGE